MKLFFAQNYLGKVIYRAERWDQKPNIPMMAQDCFVHDYTMDLDEAQKADIEDKGWTDIPPPPDYFEPIPSLNFE